MDQVDLSHGHAVDKMWGLIQCKCHAVCHVDKDQLVWAERQDLGHGLNHDKAKEQGLCQNMHVQHEYL
eukprot:15366559-Ditylum_brightwellii.AAC.1